MHLRRRNGASLFLSLMKGITGYKIVPTIGERKISFLHCLFFFLPSAFLVFFLLLFLLSAFFYPHFPIRIFPSTSAIRRYPVRVLQTPAIVYPATALLLEGNITAVDFNFLFHFSFRSGMAFISGIFMYTITWILLKTDGGDQRISPSQWKDFMVKLDYE